MAATNVSLEEWQAPLALRTNVTIYYLQYLPQVFNIKNGLIGIILDLP
jgi:hypothetical protein